MVKRILKDITYNENNTGLVIKYYHTVYASTFIIIIPPSYIHCNPNALIEIYGPDVYEIIKEIMPQILNYDHFP